jgi:ectoine hydroxylase-related dioxygenase (phytanoyl-CoA dioxygenase family)
MHLAKVLVSCWQLTNAFSSQNYYFRVARDDDVLTLWVSLDDADRENGCMHFINTAIEAAKLVQHNQDPTRATYLIAETTAEERASQGYGEVRSGGVVAWSGATIHGSNANSSGRWRRAFAVHFIRDGFAMRSGVPEPDLSELNDTHAAIVARL